MAWRVTLNGAMVEVVNGVRDGREITSTIIAREGQVIEKDMTSDFVERWRSEEPYARSIAEYGNVETVPADEEGEEDRKVFVATALPEPEETPSSRPVEASTDAELIERVQKADDRVKELEGELATAEEAASAPQAIPYERLSSEALAVEADKRGVTPASGSGKDGNVVKLDLVKALQEADAPA